MEWCAQRGLGRALHWHQAQRHEVFRSFREVLRRLPVVGVYVDEWSGACRAHVRRGAGRAASAVAAGSEATGESSSRYELLTAGFPCQSFCKAGLKTGAY